IHQTDHLERLLRAVRVRPGSLDLYLEILGLEQIRRAVYRAGASLRVRYDDRLLADLETALGPGGCVRLLGQRGATTRIDSGASSGTSQRPLAGTVAPPAHGPDVEPDESALDDLDDD